MKSNKAQNLGDWVEESKFGNWFINSNTWIHYVLKLALDSLEELLDPKQNEYPIILDVGCGYGHSLVELDKRFKPKKIIGLDVDPELVERTKKNLPHCTCEVELKINNACKIDLPDHSVDMVLCHQTFHHIIDQENAIKEFYRVLKPGGVLLFAETCRSYIYSFFIRLLFRHPMGVQKTDEEYLSLVRQAGFSYQSKNVSKPFLWWSRGDLGLLEKCGWAPKKDREETLVYLVAYRPE
ncbi:MAG: ubiquinone/menaquinone biosynthesis C-methylase UbiE [Candidatus Endobugula sp.]|jgi:ubiquinone/menaquinone biosynthesis C-methylase UbiE